MTNQAQVTNAPAQKLGDVEMKKAWNNWKMLSAAIDSLNQKFDKMKASFVDPMAASSDQNVRKVIDAMEAYNSALKQFNGDKDVIPVSGKDYQQKFASINAWLKNGENAPFEPATMKAIAEKSQAAFKVVNNYSLAMAAADTATEQTAPAAVRPAARVADALRAQQPALADTTPTKATTPPAASKAAAPTSIEFAEQKITAKKPAAAQTTAPAATTTAPAATTAAPAHATMVAAFSELVKKNLDDLIFISQYASESRIPDAARKMVTSLTAASHDADQVQNLPVGTTKRAQKEKAFTVANSAAIKFISANINAAEAAQRRTLAAPFVQHARYNEVEQLAKDLDALDSATSHAIDSATSHDIKRFLPSIWLVGEMQMGQMLDSLKAAYNSMKAGKETDARMQFGAATAVFEAEQKLYRRMLNEFVAAPASTTIAMLSQSTLPDKDKLIAMLQTNVNSANLMLARADVAYPIMADLFDRAWTDEKGVKMLLDAWNYAQSPDCQAMMKKMQSLSFGQELNAYFADAVKTLSERAFTFKNPTYTTERRKAIAALYLHVTTVSDRDLIRAEKEIAELLKSSPEYRYLDVFTKIYETIAQITPQIEGPAAESASSIAKLRALRTVMDMNYSEFVYGMNQGEFPEASVDKARGFLQSAINVAKAGGLKDDDPLVKAAESMMKGTAKTSDAATAAYEAAGGLLAIREAQLWVTTSVIRNPQADIAATTTALTEATEIYLATFSGMNGRIPYHPNDARKLAEDAILLAAPPLLAITDATATYTTFVWYRNPITTTGANNTATEADMATSAIAAEQMHINLLVRSMTSPDFMRSSTYKAFETAQIASTFSSLDPRIGRSNEVARQYGFPLMIKAQTTFGTTETRVDIHFDTEGLPHENRFLQKYGPLYQEVAKQHNMAWDTSTASVLRGMISTPALYGQMPLDANVALLEKAGDEGKRMAEAEKARISELRSNVTAIAVNGMHMSVDKPLLPQFLSSMQQAAANFAPPSRTPTPQSMAAAVDKVFVALLDVRIAEAEHRLGGATVLNEDKKPIRISELAYSTDDRTVANAKTFLTVAKEIRERAKTGAVSGREFQEAIISAENCISVLSDDNLSNIKRPKTRTGTYVVLDQPQRDMERYTYKVLETHFRTADGRDLTQAQYEKEFGPQTVHYYWYVWDSFKRTDAKGQRENVEYLYHPYYVGIDDTTKAGYAPKYVGQVMRGASVKMRDGATVNGDFVVRVRLTEYRSDQPQWEPVDKGKTLNYDNVLFQLDRGTRSPLSNDMFKGSLAKVRSGALEPFSWPGSEQLLISHPADVSVVAVPRPVKEFSTTSATVAVPKPATK